MRALVLSLMLPLASLATPSEAENASYGEVWLSGLARDSWPFNPPGAQLAMVCNVNGPDGFLSVRAGPGTQFDIRRKLNRLAILEVDTSKRAGRWVAVTTAYRTVTKDGVGQAARSLHVSGWAHDGFLCDFVH